MISGCRLASSATSGARWPGVSTQATASLRGAAAAPPAPAAIPARNAATILKTAALRIALSPLVRAFARVPVPPAAPSCHRTSLARAAALGENRLGAHQAPDMVDRLDKGAGSRQFGVFLVEADVDDLLDAPGTGRHHGDPLGEKDRFLHVVGDEDHGLARMLPDAQQLHLHQAAGLRVERAEGLVHQQDARIDGERAGDCRALLHAARELRGIAVLEPAETDEIDEGAGAPLALIPRYPLFFKTVKNILQNRLPGKQGKVLKDNATVGTGAGNRLAFDQDRAGLDRQKAADQIEQCALAAAAWTEQRDELAVAHAERYLVERQDRAAARRPIDMADPVDDDLRRIRHDRVLLCRRRGPSTRRREGWRAPALRRYYARQHNEGASADADPQSLYRCERPVAFPRYRGRMGRRDARRQTVETITGHRHHFSRGPADLRSRLASGAAPAVHHQPRRRGSDHGQRRRVPGDRRRRGAARRGYDRQGPPVESRRRQDPPLHLRTRGIGSASR